MDTSLTNHEAMTDVQRLHDEYSRSAKKVNYHCTIDDEYSLHWRGRPGILEVYISLPGTYENLLHFIDCVDRALRPSNHTLIPF
jgi:hypothetical protein